MSASPNLPARAPGANWLVLCFAAVGALTLAHPSATRAQTWPWALATAALWLSPSAWVLAGLLRGTPWRVPPTPAAIGLALLGLGAAASAHASPFGPLSLAPATCVLGGVALCLGLHHWLSHPGEANARRDLVARTSGALGAIVAAASLRGWLATDGVERNPVPFGHSTYTAGFVLLTLPWIVERAGRTRGLARAAWAAGALVSLATLISTSSRGGVLALGAVALAGIVALIARAPWSQRRKRLLATAAATTIAAVFLANPRLRDLALRRSWSDAARASNLERSAMLDAGWRLGRERPALGWGPGAIPLAYPRVRAQLAGGNENVLQLHNAPAQLWATLGAVGLGAAVLIGAGLVGPLRRAGEPSPARPTTLAAAAALGGYALFSLTDHQLDLPAIAAMGAVAVAMLTATASRTITAPVLRWASSAALVAALAGPAWALGRDLLARRAYDDALGAMERGDPPAVLAALDRATAWLPGDPFFQHHAADALMRERDRATSRSRQLELTSAAIARLEASLRTGVHLEYAHFNLGWLLLEIERPGEAGAHFAAAARLVPDKGGVYLGLGLARQALGRDGEAIRCFALEWLNDPRQFTSPAWEVPALAALKPAVRAELLRLLERAAAAWPGAAAPAEWIRWWHGEPVPAARLAGGFSHESAAFAQLLATGAAPAPANSAPWARLHAAWREGRGLDSPPADPALAAALLRRSREHRSDFREFLTAPIGDQPALASTFRRQRRGFGVLATHPEGPPLTDAYIVQENRAVAAFAARLFPPKGWLPGRFLLAWLPPTPP